MNYIPNETSVVFQELPDNISLTFSITGCGKQCPGCHSPHLQDSKNGEELTVGKFRKHIEQYRKHITAIIFFGGDLFKKEILELIKIAKQEYGLLVCLYSGFDEIDSDIFKKLDYVKLGDYRERLGGLISKNTNQIMFDLNKKEEINYKFYKKTT